MTAGTAVDDAEFLETSRRAIVDARDAEGADPLTALGWWDLLDDLDDPEVRAAAFALFRAQGRELGDTNALGALAAVPYVAALRPERRLVATVVRESRRRGTVHLLVGPPPSDGVLLDHPGRGVSVAAVDDLTLVPVEIPGRWTLHEVRVDPADLEPFVDDAEARVARSRSERFGRLATAFEMLGAVDGVLALALDHARTREQFGQPIGTFQAVRHLLAWALTDGAAIEAVATAARDLDDAVPERFDAVAKALAGRNARRACERTLQVLGAIGFTAELDHHHFHSRVLALDSVLGSSAELTTGLGAWLRETGADPGVARALLFGGGTTT